MTSLAWLRKGAGNFPTASSFNLPPCERRLGNGDVGLGSYTDVLDLHIERKNKNAIGGVGTFKNISLDVAAVVVLGGVGGRGLGGECKNDEAYTGVIARPVETD